MTSWHLITQLFQLDPFKAPGTSDLSHTTRPLCVSASDGRKAAPLHKVTQEPRVHYISEMDHLCPPPNPQKAVHTKGEDTGGFLRLAILCKSRKAETRQFKADSFVIKKRRT